MRLTRPGDPPRWARFKAQHRQYRIDYIAWQIVDEVILEPGGRWMVGDCLVRNRELDTVTQPMRRVVHYHVPYSRSASGQHRWKRAWAEVRG